MSLTGSTADFCIATALDPSCVDASEEEPEENIAVEDASEEHSSAESS
jgi:hypothetical protein